jgi:hypothetical protein
MVELSELQDLTVSIDDIGVSNGVGLQYGRPVLLAPDYKGGAVDVYVSNLVTFPNHADKQHVMWAAEYDASHPTERQNLTVQVPGDIFCNVQPVMQAPICTCHLSIQPTLVNSTEIVAPERVLPERVAECHCAGTAQRL